MVLKEVLEVTSALKPQYDDDLVDQLHYYHTGRALLGAAIFVLLFLFVGHPIECWTPAQYKEPWVKYTGTISSELQAQ